MEFDRTADTLNTCSFDVQSIKMLTMCAVLQLYVFCSVCDAVKEHELLSFSLVIVMSFVRWPHIIFQYIQINCDFTLTMKLPWFLLNLVWLCMTNIQAVKLARCLALYDALTTTKASIASLTSFFLTPFFIVVHFTYEMACFVAGF